MSDSPKDDELWAKEIESVKPLDDRCRVMPEVKVPTPRKEMEVEPQASVVFVKEREESGEFKLGEGSSISGACSSVSPKIRKKLAKGEIAFEARLDLHGLRVREAKQMLDKFIGGTGARCILVVHGKGKSGGGEIRGSMSRWLEGNAAVLAFCAAVPKHGGDGAVYVLLRKS